MDIKSDDQMSNITHNTYYHIKILSEASFSDIIEIMQTCHSIEVKNLDLTDKKSGSGGKNRDHGPIGYKNK